ncbi:30S ribosomal protein S20 [Candidatus Gracilibacteria bacterium]|nr:30S ribosomal protein S20 [Candidatus Gracilibacteria bacterium]
MPIIKASIKDLRKSNKRRLVNRVYRDTLKDTMKDMMKLVKAKKMDEFIKKMPEAMSVIDKSVKHNLLHKNNAARKKSALASLAKKTA